jgi:hypothetical protein
MQISRIKIVSVALLITLIAGGLRIFAAKKLYADNDEATYMKRATAYANFIRAGQYDKLVNYDQTYEHPALYKILYGVILLTRRPLDVFSSAQISSDQPVIESDVATWVMADRYLSVTFGTLATLFLAIVDPLAGFFLATNTLSVKYTSEVYLEALPLLTSLLCALTYLRWFDQMQKESAASNRSDWWLAASALFLGLTAASKYVYCVIGIAILLHFIMALIQKQIPARLLLHMLTWSLAALIIFFVFDPYLWSNPIARLSQSILYNFNYQQSIYVIRANYPVWQPLRWLSLFSSSYDLGPYPAFMFNIDIIIFLLAVIGLPRLFRQRRLFFYWFLIALAFLLAWNTKWPQYTLIVMIPFTVSASEGAISTCEFVRNFLLSPESR